MGLYLLVPPSIFGSRTQMMPVPTGRSMRTKIVCEKVGNDMVDGRKTVKYKRPTTNSEADYIWVDPKLNYVIKWHMDKTDAELRNIAEGPQSAGLFVIPQGYEPLRPSKKQSRSTPRPR